jgi:hypothetical protein
LRAGSRKEDDLKVCLESNYEGRPNQFHAESLVAPGQAWVRRANLQAPSFAGLDRASSALRSPWVHSISCESIRFSGFSLGQESLRLQFAPPDLRHLAAKGSTGPR